MASYSQSERREIGARLKHVRSHADGGRGLLQAEMASRLACSLSHYSKCELGQCSVSRRFLSNTAAALGISFEWLETGEGKQGSVAEPQPSPAALTPDPAKLVAVVDTMLDDATRDAVASLAKLAGISERQAWIAILREKVWPTEDD